MKNRKHFLKRVKPSPEVDPSQLYIGSIITVYARQLKLLEYADEHTRQAVDGRVERCVGFGGGAPTNQRCLARPSLGVAALPCQRALTPDAAASKHALPRAFPVHCTCSAPARARARAPTRRPLPGARAAEHSA
jgi:hypothetical protein